MGTGDAYKTGTHVICDTSDLGLLFSFDGIAANIISLQTLQSSVKSLQAAPGGQGVPKALIVFGSANSYPGSRILNFNNISVGVVHYFLVRATGTLAISSVALTLNGATYNVTALPFTTPATVNYTVSGLFQASAVVTFSDGSKETETALFTVN